MEIILHTLIVLELSWTAKSFNVYEPARVPGWNYFGYSWMDQKPSFVFRKPMAAMVDLTNDLGVAILQDYSYSRSNFAFSPYGVASVLVVLYEGARGESAQQIHRAVKFPWDKDITRIGFRDIHRHLRSYFSHEGYLSGITLSKDGSTLKPEYKRILRFYGYDVDVDSPERTSDVPPTTTESLSSVPTTNTTVTRSETTTTGGYDVTTVKDSAETNVAESTINPEDITTLSYDETTTTLTMVEDRESTVSPATSMDSSSTTDTRETVTGTTEGSVTAPEENEGTSSQQNPLHVESTNQEDAQKDVEQSISEENIQDSQQGDQNSEQVMKQNTEESIPDAGLQDVEQYNSSSTEQNNVHDAQENTEDTELDAAQLTTEQISVQESETQESDQNSSAGIEQDTENIEPDTEEDTEQVTHQSIEESTPEGIEEGAERNVTNMTPPVTPAGDNFSTITNPVTAGVTQIGAESMTEYGETTTTTEKVEEITISTPANIEAELAAMEEAEVEGNLTTEEGERNSRSDALDNGMLIPQLKDGRYSYFEDKLGLASVNPDKKNMIDDEDKLGSKSENWKELGVALIADGDEVKWEPKTLEEFLENLMRERGISDGGNRYPRLASGKSERWRRHERDSSQSTRDSPEEKFMLKSTGKSISNSTGKRLPVNVETSAKLKRRHSTKEKRNISEFLKIPPVTDLSLQLQNGMFDSHVSKDTDLYRVLPKFLFLVDGAIDTPVPMMTYTNVFPFAYIPRLHCKALEFPLDDERYKLLILLPVERRGLRQLIYDLGSYSLGEVIGVLRPARVKAMVPTFMVEGFVILTPTLQKMGIWDVFDPRRADLSGMTTDPDLYVRNIEQSVTVVIRNYVEILDIQTRTMAARHIDEDFTASHPFLYFVMDTATNVALMAGQMLDPLNSRIY